MSIHHLDTFRYWFGDPVACLASVRPIRERRPSFRTRTASLYILEYDQGLRASGVGRRLGRPRSAEQDIGIHWRVEGTEGLARGTIGWPDYPHAAPSTLDYTSTKGPGAGNAALAGSVVSRRLRRHHGAAAVRSNGVPNRRSAVATISKRWPWSTPATCRRGNIGP